MLKSFFSGDKYQTEGNKRVFADKLFLNTRGYFIYGYAKEIFSGRSLAEKGEYDTQNWAASSYRIFENVEKSGGKVYIEGMDNIDKVNGPVVFVSNHMGTLETFLFPCIIAPKKAVTYVVKESLVKNPIFGAVMRSRNPIVVSRKNSREDLIRVLSQGKDILCSGTSIILFPEGTRQETFSPEKFNSLGIKLAKEAGVPVIPVAIKTDFFGIGKLFKDVGPVRRKEPICISFGEAIYISGNGKAEHKQVLSFIGEKIDDFKKIKV